MQFVNLHCHSFFFSLLDGLSSPKKICEVAAKYDYKAVAVTDHGAVSAAPAIQRAAKDAGLKSILGSELYLSLDCKDKSKENRKLSHLCVLAKNLKGWQQLMRINSEANEEEHYYYRPRLDLKTLANFLDGNILSFSGHLGSDLANVWFDKSPYKANSIEEVRECLDPYGREKARMLATLYREIFGPENFFFEIQLIDSDRLFAARLVAEQLRDLSKEMKIPCVATADSHYPNREDAEDQRILLCSNFGTTLQKVQDAIARGDDAMLGGFFKSNSYHIPSPTEMEALHTEEELANSVLIADMCDDYSILRPPQLPKFPDCDNSTEYLKQLVEDGWKRKIENQVDKSQHQTYRDRVKYELDTFTSIDLADYFLIVQDYVNHFKKKDVLCGVGRGSAGGSLVAYLLNIIEVDPIPNNLIFERFYNAGRNSPGKVSLPDIDMDFPTEMRNEVIQYIKDKFGEDRVAHIATFGRLQGRGALKAVFRAHGGISNEEMNRITEYIVDESKIADELQEMREDGEEPSIIGWALENNAKELSEWCTLKDDGTLEGPLASRFAQAIRLEGVKISQGLHPSGIIISRDILSNVCPMIRSKNNGLIVGLEYTDAEAMGQPKVDILGLSLLDKLTDARDMIRNGYTG